MQDYLLTASLNDFYKRSKNVTWRKQILEGSTALFKFLKDNDLLLVDPFDNEGNLKSDLTLMRSHVTDIGDAMFNKVIPNWHKARDKDGNYDNIEILKKGLEKIKAAQG